MGEKTSATDPLPPGLYIVAGPIGNLADLSPRAADWLRRADIIACEDTRVSATLLRAAGSDRPMTPYHDHSDERARARLLARMADRAVVLLSDAGTPLISDPGYRLVRGAHEAGITVTTAPGPCAAIAALSIAGLPSDRFLFAGFLPAKRAARTTELRTLATMPATLLFYESGPRLAAMLLDAAATLGARDAAVARELTKRHEELRRGTLGDLATHYADAPEPKGEIVVLIGPPSAAQSATAADLDTALLAALATMPAGRAAASVSAALGLPRATVYARALELKAG
ncbi:16S rRNA (cytidine(1402)-2'-O)-methyltransferase [Sandaracinobacteroides saxicola]|uniref:Ribosomal RNA small subunit methyltransferase I n=1 Tax=Sandaracinobacteroides saxicola TaxID=2759707 RepID=A0A7G5IGD7_9SPHN|nr:16S rRNA (cytidine(1402)-2'-O)-methyltransferase [Sandaracinobacteroides saxicola]QMW22429.1 16S rRNA (cytidine(1402)-2'-O)-methyltransferase [Sandaracinobacteroides saxicola]